jgi:hypothetical protein
MERKILVLLMGLMLLTSVACAEDLLKPLIDTFFGAIKALVDIIVSVIFGLFPGLKESLSADILAPIAKDWPWIRGFYWLIYLAAFFAVMAILAKLWSMGEHFILNTIAGLILLLILIHLFGVEIQITLLVLILTAIFGVPGVILVVILHYLGIPL